MATQRLRGNSFGDMAAQGPREVVVPRTPGTGVAVSNRPNFTMGGNGAPPSAPPAAASVPAVNTRPNFTMGGTPPAASSGAAFKMSTPTPPVAEARLATPGFRAGKEAGRAFGGALRGPVARLVPGGAAVGSMLEDADRVNTTLADPNATTLRKTGVVAGALGKAGASAAGAVAGAKVGAAGGALLGPIGAAVGGLGGGLVGGYLGGRGAQAGIDAIERPPEDMGMTGAGTDAKLRTGDFNTARTAGTGSGRGSNADPNRSDVDPTDPRFGAARDFSRDLASVPKDLPSDMRSGVILKTKDANGRTVYSGRDVGADAPMVDGMGKTLRGGGGTVSTVPGMAPGEAQAILARPAPGGQGVGGGGGFGGSGGLTASGGLFDTPKARRAAQALNLTEQNMRLDNAATLRGQDVTARGNELTYGASMAGVAQRDAAARLPLQAAAAARQRVAGYLRGPQGNAVDPAAAINAAAAAGDTDAVEALSKMADAGDKRASTRDTAVDSLLKPLATYQGADGKPGGVDEGVLQTLRADLSGIATQMGKKSVEELLEDGPAARAAVATLQGMNSRKDNGVGQMLGYDKQSTRERQLPDFTGAQSEQVGFFEGLLTPGGVERGDRKITLRGNQGVRYIPQDVFADQDVQGLLRGRGMTK